VYGVEGWLKIYLLGSTNVAAAAICDSVLVSALGDDYRRIWILSNLESCVIQTEVWGWNWTWAAFVPCQVIVLMFHCHVSFAIFFSERLVECLIPEHFSLPSMGDWSLGVVLQEQQVQIAD